MFYIIIIYITLRSYSQEDLIIVYQLQVLCIFNVKSCGKLVKCIKIHIYILD